MLVALLIVAAIAYWILYVHAPRRSAFAAVSRDSETYVASLDFCKDQHPKFHARLISNLNEFYAAYQKSFDASACTPEHLAAMHRHKSRALKSLREIDQRMFNDARARTAVHVARRNLDHIMRAHVEDARTRCGLPAITLEPIDDYHHIRFVKAANDDL